MQTPQPDRVGTVPTLFAKLGGEPKLRAIIAALVARMADDLMIGFFFRRVPLARLAEREFEHAAAFLGAPVAYTGRPLEVAHRRLKIFGGHFDRRLALLGAVLDDFGVSQEVRGPWLAHQRAQREWVLG